MDSYKNPAPTKYLLAKILLYNNKILIIVIK